MINLFLDVLNLNWKLRRQCPSVLVLRQDLPWEGESVHPGIYGTPPVIKPGAVWSLVRPCSKKRGTKS